MVGLVGNSNGGLSLVRVEEFQENLQPYVLQNGLAYYSTKYSTKIISFS